MATNIKFAVVWYESISTTHELLLKELSLAGIEIIRRDWKDQTCDVLQDTALIYIAESYWSQPLDEDFVFSFAGTQQ
jgi:hypothetical protein